MVLRIGKVAKQLRHARAHAMAQLPPLLGIVGLRWVKRLRQSGEDFEAWCIEGPWVAGVLESLIERPRVAALGF